MNTRADRVFRVVDSDWTITSVLRIISGAVFTVSGYAMAEPQGIKRLAPKRKCKFNDDWKTDYAWIAKLPDTGMAQCNLCATDFSVSSGGRTDVRRHQESVRHARLAKSRGSTKGWMLQYVAHGENEVDCVTRAETMVAYWIAHHNLPMSAADEFSRMVPKLFPDSKIAKTVFSWLHIYIPDLLIS